MIITEMTLDGRIRHISDQNVMIKQIETGNLYQDAVDKIPCKFTYEETNINIQQEEE